MDTFDITREFIDNILNGNAVGAEANFQDIVSVKAHDVLSGRKQEISSSLYAGSQESPQGTEE